MPPPVYPPGRSKDSKDPWSIAAGGTQLAVSVLLGVYIGYRLDRRWNSGPWLLVAGAALGLVAGLYVFLKPLLTKDATR